MERQGFKAVILLSLTAEIININSHGFIEKYLTPEKLFGNRQSIWGKSCNKLKHAKTIQYFERLLSRVQG